MGPCTYDIFVDLEETISEVGSGTYTINNVSIGTHTFEAFDTCEGFPHGTDYEVQYIGEGENWVYLNPKP
jgi:hypothetical protein